MRMIHDKDGIHISYSHKIVYLLLSPVWSLCNHKLKIFFKMTYYQPLKVIWGHTSSSNESQMLLKKI